MKIFGQPIFAEMKKSCEHWVKSICQLRFSTRFDAFRAGLDRSDFVLHEAHKKKESKDPASNKKVQDKSKKRKETSSSQADDAEQGVRRSARQLGIKAEISERAESGFQDEDGTARKSERAMKDLSGSLADHANAEREHLRWAGSALFCFGVWFDLLSQAPTDLLTNVNIYVSTNHTY
jgi:hypothetical protein